MAKFLHVAIFPAQTSTPVRPPCTLICQSFQIESDIEGSSAQQSIQTESDVEDSSSAPGLIVSRGLLAGWFVGGLILL